MGLHADRSTIRAQPGGTIIEGFYAISDGVLYLEDAQHNPVASQQLRSDDNPVAVARRLLRERRSPNKAFYAPIIYPHRVAAPLRCMSVP